MMKEKLKNKKVVYTIIGIVAVLLVAIAVSYAYWLVTKSQTEKNKIVAGCLEIDYIENSDAISLIDQYPLSDEDSYTLMPYTFTVTNTCETFVDYQIALETYASNTLTNDSYIKIMLDEDDSEILSTNLVTDPTIEEADNSYVLKTGTLTSKGSRGDTKVHSLRLWIDENTPVSEAGKVFESKITVTIGQGITNPTLCKAATAATVTTGNIPKGNYENGDEYICEVKDNTFYHFFIIGQEETGEINLIADQNMVSGGVPATAENVGTVAWLNKSDYDSAVASGNVTANTLCGLSTMNKYLGYTCAYAGPITALNALKNVVSSWENIPERLYSTKDPAVMPATNADYVYSASQQYIEHGYNYPEIKTTSRARLITPKEAYNNGCEFIYSVSATEKYNIASCPLYMVNYMEYKDSDLINFDDYQDYEYYDNVLLMKEKATVVKGVRGYWTSAVLPGNASKGSCAAGILDTGAMDCHWTGEATYNGLRPVITLFTTDLG